MVYLLHNYKFILVLTSLILLFADLGKDHSIPYYGSVSSFSVEHVDSTFYYSSLDFPDQIVKIELDEPITLNGITIFLDGDGIGNFDLDIYGHEGGANRPVFKNELISTATLMKDSIGYHKIEYKLEQSIELNNDYFFVYLSNFAGNFGVQCDSVMINHCNSKTKDNYSTPLILRDTSGTYVKKWVNPKVELDYTKKPNLEPFFVEKEVLSRPHIFSPSQSISWAEVNGDSLVDLLIGNNIWVNKLNTFDGAISMGADARWSTFIDFDNDNDMDVIVFGRRGVSLYSNDKGVFTFFKAFENLPRIKPEAICIADYNNDNFPDLLIGQLWSSYPKPLANYLFANQDGLDLVDQSSELYPHHAGVNNFPFNQEMGFDSTSYVPSPNLNLNKRSRAAQFIDYDQDGDQDIYIANYFLESDELFENLSDGKFKQKLTAIDSIILTDPKCHDNYFNHGTGISWADFDNDGDFDYILSQLSHPQLMIEYGHLGTTLFENTGNQWNQIDNNAGIQYEETHAGVTFVDIDNDGLQDIVIGAFYDCRYLDIYVQKPDHTFELKTFESGLNKISGIHDICIVDYNNDGKQDICFIDDTVFRMFENQTNNTNNWLKIKLEGNSVNKYGIGVTVRIFCGDDVYTKQLSSGSGQAMQSPPLLHFGIAEHQSVEKIEIVWHTDKIQVLENVKVNQLFEIVEN